MLETKEKRGSSVYPYPQRSSELIQHPDFLQEISPIQLTEKERGQLRIFEKPFFTEIKRLKEIPAEDHAIYPEAFTTDTGSRLFSAVYFDKDLKERVERLAKENNIDWKDLEKKRSVYEAFFDDFLKVASNESSFVEYCEKGVVFPKLQKALSLEMPLVFKGNVPRMSDEDNEEVFDVDFIEKVFFETDLEKTPKRVRERMSQYSSDWEKDKFKDELVRTGGDVSIIENPQRIARIVNVNDLIDKLQGYRDLKSNLKRVRQQLGTEPDSFAEAKQIVLDLYQRYINVLIANQYANGRILTAQPKRGKKEKEALSILRAVEGEVKGDRFAPEKASRTLERIDHFLRGTGLKIGENGFFETIPQNLEKYAKTRASELSPKETEKYKRYNKYKVNAEQAKKICDVILAQYDLLKGGKKWSTVVLERKRTLIVIFKEEDVKVREVRIPRSFDRGLIKTLTTLSHEVEGHVLRHINQELGLGSELSLLDELTTGRSAILAEALSMKVEDDTRNAIVGFKRKAKPYYYEVLREKSKGGSFKECLRASLETRARRERNMTLKELLANKKIFSKTFPKAYSSTLRIFREHTPLNDKSSFLPTSSQLKYIEQELVMEVLTSEEARKSGLLKLLYIAGIDLYSVQDLKRLGMLDLRKVREPEMVVARKIWPILKKSLDEGISLDGAIEELRDLL